MRWGHCRMIRFVYSNHNHYSIVTALILNLCEVLYRNTLLYLAFCYGPYHSFGLQYNLGPRVLLW